MHLNADYINTNTCKNYSTLLCLLLPTGIPPRHTAASQRQQQGHVPPLAFQLG
jgi:hypothetical protein